MSEDVKPLSAEELSQKRERAELHPHLPWGIATVRRLLATIAAVQAERDAARQNRDAWQHSHVRLEVHSSGIISALRARAEKAIALLTQKQDIEYHGHARELSRLISLALAELRGDPPSQRAGLSNHATDRAEQPGDGA